MVLRYHTSSSSSPHYSFLGDLQMATTTRKHVSTAELLKEAAQNKYKESRNPIGDLSEATGIKPTMLKVRLKKFLEDYAYEAVTWRPILEKFLGRQRRLDITALTMEVQEMSLEDLEKARREAINQMADKEKKNPDALEAELKKKEEEKKVSKKSQPPKNAANAGKRGRPKKAATS